MSLRPRSKFQTRVPAKWVLAGEHSVLRGSTAVALPHPEFSLQLEFQPGGDGFTVSPAAASRVVLDLITAVNDERSEQERPEFRPEGLISITSDIPVGAGLGSSAALCVALTRWFAEPLEIPRSETFEFARRLEHRFHGRSSGMDVAVTSSGEPISFSMSQGPRPLGVKKLPKFRFHDTSLRSRTSDCVVKVEEFREEKPVLAMKTDEQMAAAARQAMEGLARFDRGDEAAALTLLTQAMKQGQESFYTWQLVPGEARRMEERLYEEGALAVKLTGAGGGGFLVSLWA